MIFDAMAEYDEERRLERLERTKPARESLPRWPWARFGDPSIERRVHAKLLAVAKAWTPAAGNLVLFGPTGDGKTTAATAMAHRLIDAAVASDLPHTEARWATGLRFVSAAELVAARKEMRLGTGEAPLVHGAMRASLLILDELGFEPIDSVILEVADARYKANRVTITTSGLTEERFARRYGDAVLRRLSELGQVIDVHPATAPDPGKGARRLRGWPTVYRLPRRRVRRILTALHRRGHLEFARWEQRVCPFCDAPIFDARGGFVGGFHHHDVETDADADTTVPCCKACESRREPGPHPIIADYHERRHRFIGPLFARSGIAA